MRIVTIGSLAAIASSAAVAANSGGFLVGETVPVVFSSPDGAFAGSAQVQTSNDGVTWTNAGVVHASAGTNIQALVLGAFNRLNCTARTAGTVSAVALGAVG